MDEDESTIDRATATKLVQGVLHTIAQLLRDGPPLTPEAQQLLADIADELGRTLESDVVPAAALNQLAEHVAELIEAAHEGQDVGFAGHVRDRLERAAAALESRAPLLTGLTRRLIETLADLGI